MAKKTDGKKLEKIVQIFEKLLSPDSIVKHNVQMPIISSQKGFTTQCDVVIWEGEKPRQIITICEVQDRKTAMSANDFRGFREKMIDIGAQRLICIAKKEFTNSIIEKAANSNGTLILMNISDDYEDFPINYQSEYQNVEISELGFDIKIKLGKDKNNEKLVKQVENYFELKNINEKIGEKIFTLNKQDFLSFTSLCSLYLEINCVDEEFFGEDSFIIDIKKDPPLYVKFMNKYYRIGLECNFKYKVTLEINEPYFYSYEQIEGGILAWVVEHNSDIRGKYKMVFIKNKNDNWDLFLNGLEIPYGNKFFINIEKS